MVKSYQSSHLLVFSVCPCRPSWDVAHFRSGGLLGVLVVRLRHLVQLSFFGPMFSFEAERPA